MRLLYIGLVIGSLSGGFVPRLMAKNEVRYAIGDCLSNGLYYERVTSIRYSKLSFEAIYDLVPTIQGRLAAPDSTDAWIVHDSYVLVAKKHCL